MNGKQPKLVVPQFLIQDVIAENHNSNFVAHLGNKRTLELISLMYWWPKIRQNIEECVRRCDKCQTMKGKHEFQTLLEETEDPSDLFQVTSVDITGQYSITLRKYKYLLTSSAISQGMSKPSRCRTFRQKLLQEFTLQR